MHDGVRDHLRNLLRHDPDVRLITPLVAISVETDTVVEAADLDNVTLQSNVRHRHNNEAFQIVGLNEPQYLGERIW